MTGQASGSGNAAAPAERGGVAASGEIRQDSLGRSVLKNTGAQIVGRLLIALSRLVIAGIIVRTFGVGTFGEYALIFGILSFAEWMVDFGTTEVFVRELSRHPDRTQPLLRILTALKLLQVPIAFVVLCALLLGLGYPATVFQAGMVAGASLAFIGGVFIFRVVFRAELNSEREVVSEMLSVLAMIPMIALAGHAGGGLTALFACHVASRALYFVLCLAFGRHRFLPSVSGVSAADLRWARDASITIGTIGLLVVVYETLDILIVSKLATTEQLGFFSAAQRLTSPILLALASVGGTLYPVVSRFWPEAHESFVDACQKGVDSVLMLAGLALSATMAGAEFLLGLLGPDLAQGALALRVLSLLVFVKAVTSTLGPVLFVVHKPHYTLAIVIVAVGMKALTATFLAGRFGYVGVAAGSVVVEFCCALVPTVYLLRRYGNLRLRWAGALKVAACTALAAATTVLALPAGSIFTVVLAPLMYLPLLFLLGVLDVAQLRALVARRGA